MKYALCFPGQGSQKVGMGREIYDVSGNVRDVFAEADDALSMHLTKLIFDGPDEELTLTTNAQPALMTVSIAALRFLEKDLGCNLEPACGAGHSLGEYTALVAAGALSFPEAVALVRKRGQWMQEAAPMGIGSMTALLGLTPEAALGICAEVAPHGECQPANFNSPGQLVISGLTEFVDKAVALAKNKGARKAIKLNVSAPFHSNLMVPAADKLKTEFENCTSWDKAKWPIVTNSSAMPITEPDEIKLALYVQTYSPVLWQQSVEFMTTSPNDKAHTDTRGNRGFGVDTFFEIGPGEVLSGLIKRCRKGINQMSACTPEKLEDMAKLLQEAQA